MTVSFAQPSAGAFLLSFVLLRPDPDPMREDDGCEMADGLCAVWNKRIVN
jgi:hypothetical protein